MCLIPVKSNQISFQRWCQEVPILLNHLEEIVRFKVFQARSTFVRWNALQRWHQSSEITFLRSNTIEIHSYEQPNAIKAEPKFNMWLGFYGPENLLAPNQHRQTSAGTIFIHTCCYQSEQSSKNRSRIQSAFCAPTMFTILLIILS